VYLAVVATALAAIVFHFAISTADAESVLFHGDATPGRKHFEIEAVITCYGDRIQSIEIVGDEVVFRIGNEKIYYREGKMLSEAHLVRSEEFDSIFYEYKKGPISINHDHTPYPAHRSSDFLDALFGDTENQVRENSQWVHFLGHRVYVHNICVDSLVEIDRRIREQSSVAMEVRDFLKNIRVMYSMKRRHVSGTNNMSYHSYGLAIDIIPRSYGGKHVYWKWSSVFKEDWDRIPLSQRWSPPQQVIDAFEAEGFVWGGKWYYFDSLHFEYRPEILYLNEIWDRKE
jgi:hypothetical protein